MSRDTQVRLVVLIVPSQAIWDTGVLRITDHVEFAFDCDWLMRMYVVALQPSCHKSRVRVALNNWPGDRERHRKVASETTVHPSGTWQSSPIVYMYAINA